MADSRDQAEELRERTPSGDVMAVWSRSLARRGARQGQRSIGGDVQAGVIAVQFKCDLARESLVSLGRRTGGAESGRGDYAGGAKRHS